MRDADVWKETRRAVLRVVAKRGALLWFMRKGSNMRSLGIISDIHGNRDNLQAALQDFNDYAVDQALALGDVEYYEVLEEFKESNIKFYCVCGNKDKDPDELRKAVVENGGVYCGESGEIEWENHKIFFSHGHIAQLLKDAKYGGEYDVICSGHTHIQDKREDGALLLNPGPAKDGYWIVLIDQNGKLVPVTFPNCN